MLLCSFLTEAEPVSPQQGRSTENYVENGRGLVSHGDGAGGSRAGGSRVGGVALLYGQDTGHEWHKEQRPCLSSDKLSGELGVDLQLQSIEGGIRCFQVISDFACPRTCVSK